jgi:hypothetical protein
MTLASLFTRPKADAVCAVNDEKASTPEDGIPKEAGATTDDVVSDSESDSVSKDAQAGVQAIEATTSVWSKRDLILAYIL